MKVRKMSDRVMAVVLVLREGELRLICRYALQSVRSEQEKQSSMS